MPPAGILAYGALGLPLAFAALPIYVHVPRLYAETTGMSLAWLGIILLVARLLDAFSDPWLGWLADRVSRRRMVAAALPALALGFVALFHPPPGMAPLWLAGSLVLTYLGFSAATIAYQAWGAALGDSPAARLRLTAAREGFGLLGVLLAAALPGLLASDPGQGAARLAWVLPPLLACAALALFTRAGSGTAPPPPGEPLWPELHRTLADRAFRRLLAAFIASGIAAAVPATLFLFFVADVLGQAEAGAPLLALYFLAGAASLPLWVRLAGRCGRVRAWALAMALSIPAFAGAAFIGPDDVAPFAAICLASGLVLGADLALPGAIAADLGERLRRSGACFGVWNFVSKLNLALAAGLALPLLALLGYRPGAGTGLTALALSYALLPLAFRLLALGLLWHWRDSLETSS